MTSRKSVATKSESKGGYNYQKEVKQLKKDIRLKDDKIHLLNKDLKYRQDTIDLFTEGLKNKEEQLQLKDKEILSCEQNLKLLKDKIEILEKHNDEFKYETDKHSKAANIAQKKLNIAEQNNVNLLTQINSLIQNLNNLKNVNMALSSQLTMTMSARNPMQQNQYSSMPNVIPQNTVNLSTNAVVSVNNANAKFENGNGRDSLDENESNNEMKDTDNGSDTDNNGNSEDTKSDNEDAHDRVAHLPDSIPKRVKPSKKRQSMIPQSMTNMSTTTKLNRRTRSKSTGGSKQALERPWDSDTNKEKEKTKRKRSKDTKNRASRSVSNAKKMKKSANMNEDAHWDGEGKESEHNNDNNFFGNAPVEKKEKKKKRKKESTDVCFDTYLSEIESDKLKITKNGKLVAMDYFTDSLYIISSQGWNSGKHEWEFKCMKTGDLTDEIGICSAWNDLEVNGNGIADMGSSQLGSRAVYANDASTGVAFHDAYDDKNKLTYDKKFKKKGNNPSEFSWSKGDIIKVNMNLNKWSVKFYLNNKVVGGKISLTKDLTYYPILCAYGSCSYQVISCS